MTCNSRIAALNGSEQFTVSTYSTLNSDIFVADIDCAVLAGQDSNNVAVLRRLDSFCERGVVNTVYRCNVTEKRCSVRVLNILDGYISNICRGVFGVTADSAVISASAGKLYVLNRGVLDSTRTIVPAEHTAGTIGVHLKVLHSTAGNGRRRRTGAGYTAAEPTAADGDILYGTVSEFVYIVGVTNNTCYVTSVAAAGVLNVARRCINTVNGDINVSAVCPTADYNTCASVAGMSSLNLDSTGNGDVLCKSCTAACATRNYTGTLTSGYGRILEGYVLKRTVERRDKSGVGYAGLINNKVTDGIAVTVEVSSEAYGLPLSACKINVFKKINGLSALCGNHCLMEIGVYSLANLCDLLNRGIYTVLKCYHVAVCGYNSKLLSSSKSCACIKLNGEASQINVVTDNHSIANVDGRTCCLGIEVYYLRITKELNVVFCTGYRYVAACAIGSIVKIGAIKNNVFNDEVGCVRVEHPADVNALCKLDSTVLDGCCLGNLRTNLEAGGFCSI